MRKSVKVAIAFGTRPDTIKLAPLIKVMLPDPFFKVDLIDTGQHDPNVIKGILDFFKISGSVLRIRDMKENQSINDICQDVISGIDKVISALSPDIFIVQGDTSSALAVALASFNKGVPVAHVEAGLRTFDKKDPWPEEMNRIFIDMSSEILFTPTLIEEKNLMDEGISKNIYTVGNTSVDAQSYCCQTIIERYPNTNSSMLSEKFDHFALVTIHRRESFGKPLVGICMAIKSIAESHPKIKFIWPVHPNPNVSQIVKGLMKGIDNVQPCDPFDYITTQFILGSSLIVITDSGGLQEEATALAIPTIVVRERSDRVAHKTWADTRSRGLAYKNLYDKKMVIAGVGMQKILSAFSYVYEEALELKEKRNREDTNVFLRLQPVYGDGLASKRIAAYVKRFFNFEPDCMPDPPIFR